MNGRRLSLSLAAALLVTACGGPVSDEPTIQEPAVVEHPEGSPVARVTLTAEAIEKLQLRTVLVEASGKRMSVPTSALLVDPQGVFWVYTNPEPRLFVRHEVSIHRQEAGRAFLLDGPPVGTVVVSVGVAELYGAEFEIGH